MHLVYEIFSQDDITSINYRWKEHQKSFVTEYLSLIISQNGLNEGNNFLNSETRKLGNSFKRWNGEQKSKQQYMISLSKTEVYLQTFHDKFLVFHFRINEMPCFTKRFYILEKLPKHAFWNQIDHFTISFHNVYKTANLQKKYNKSCSPCSISWLYHNDWRLKDVCSKWLQNKQQRKLHVVKVLFFSPKNKNAHQHDLFCEPSWRQDTSLASYN